MGAKEGVRDDMKGITVRSERRAQFLDVTQRLVEFVREIGLREGAVIAFVPHTTAGITINENADPDVTADMEAALERAVPWAAGYAHAEGNAAAHVKASMMGSSVTVLVKGGELQLGTWQAVYFAEFDGPRTRKVWLQAMAGDGGE